MLIYRITNILNGKVYIGQTIHTLAHRKSRHLEAMRNGADRHLYRAMRKYGIENFIFEEIDHADTLEDLNYLESYYITLYDSVRTGYNMGYGGDNNVMFSDEVKSKHDEKMRSDLVRSKISKSMKAYREKHPFTDEHRAKLSAKAMGNRNFGDTIYDQSIGCYCIDSNTGKTHHFHSYLDGGLWWFNTYAPFPYSACTYQRKIKQSIELGYATYGRGSNKIQVDDIKWFREDGDVNEKVTNKA